MAAAPTTTWLVTGFPSWIARSIVREIAEQEEGALVHLLVPEDRAKEAAEFCRGLRALGSTVKVLPGDAVRMDLGLTGKEYVALAGSVDLFVNAYDVSPLRDDGPGGYGGLYGRLGDPVALTVKATQEALEFALLSRRLRQLVQIGSLTVAGEFDGVPEQALYMIGGVDEAGRAFADALVRGTQANRAEIDRLEASRRDSERKLARFDLAGMRAGAEEATTAAGGSLTALPARAVTRTPVVMGLPLYLTEPLMVDMPPMMVKVPMNTVLPAVAAVTVMGLVPAAGATAAPA